MKTIEILFGDECGRVKKNVAVSKHSLLNDHVNARSVVCFFFFLLMKPLLEVSIIVMYYEIEN